MTETLTVVAPNLQKEKRMEAAGTVAVVDLQKRRVIINERATAAVVVANLQRKEIHNS